jgi:hypothetical protein
MRFQQRVANWMLATFGFEVSNDIREQALRFGEEAIELLQASGLDKLDVLKLVARTYSRPVGDLTQEVGGTQVTLAALCHPMGIDMELAGETEQARIERPETTAKS